MNEVRDPIHGFIFFDDLERALIDSRYVQRLRYIHQLAFSHLVYPGATHTRFEHALGTMELAGRAFDAILRNSPDLAYRVFGDEDKKRRWRATIRAAALLHDVGHAPFSHASDSLFKGEVKDHEQMGSRIILRTDLSQVFASTGTYRIDPGEVAYIATGIGTPTSQAELVAKELLTGDLGIDRMDYLRRDPHMCGVSYGLFDLARLVETLMLAEAGSGEIVLAIETGGMHAAEGLLTARYFMFSQVYFHDVRVSLDEHLVRFLSRHLPEHSYPDDPAEYIKWDDIAVMHRLREDPTDEDAQALTARRHYRSVYEFTPTDLRTRLDFVEVVRGQLAQEFGDAVFLADSKKSSRSLTPGQVAVIDPDTGRQEDILERSQTLASLQPVWFVRVYASDVTRTHVRNRIIEILSEPEESPEEEVDA